MTNTKDEARCSDVFLQQAVFSDLQAFGERISGEVDAWGRECEVNPPRLVPFDPWGRRVDHIVTSPAWQRMKELSASEGLVAIGYERSCGEWRSGESNYRLHVALLYYCSVRSAVIPMFPIRDEEGTSDI